MLKTITLEVPEEIVAMADDRGALKRRLFEDIVIAEFQRGNLTISESALLLGLTYEGFLTWLGQHQLSFITASDDELANSYTKFEDFLQTPLPA